MARHDISEILEQEANADVPIDVREAGSVRLPSKLEQFWNALFPMEVTFPGIVNEPVKPEQLLKA
mgnify:CR=1 FL=1